MHESQDIFWPIYVPGAGGDRTEPETFVKLIFKGTVKPNSYKGKKLVN